MYKTSNTALVSALGWSGSMFAVGVDILHSTFKRKFAETANWKQATTEYKQQLWRGASHMSEQRCRLGDACVLAVPAEYAGASSGSGDHPQQYYLHRPKLTTLEEKDFFLIFFIDFFPILWGSWYYFFCGAFLRGILRCLAPEALAPQKAPQKEPS